MIQRETSVETPPPLLPVGLAPDVPVAEFVPPEEPPSPRPLDAPDVLPELPPELPPEGGVVAEPGLVSVSAGGGVVGVDGATSGVVCAGGAALVRPCSAPEPPSPPRLQAVRLIAIKHDNPRIFDAYNVEVITDPFNGR